MTKVTAGKILIAFALLLISTSLASAQSGATISGRVSDPQGAVVPGATVRLYARERPVRLTASADATGAYRFEQLAPGDYLIEAEAPGFARTLAQELRVERGAAVTLDLALPIEGVRTEVVIVAASTAQPVDEVSKAVTVVGRNEIDERDEFSVAEALRTVPGLRVQQLGGPGSLTSIKARGLRNQDTAVLIDGFRLRDAAAPQGDATAFLSDLIVTDLSRVEVLRGTGSPLYGTNAMGGVINIVTDEGGGPLHGNLLLEGGGLGLFRGRAQVAGGSRADRIVYSAGLAHLNVTRGVDGDDAARNTSGQGRALFRLTPTATLSARVYTADSFLKLNASPQAVGALPPAGVIKAVPLSPVELRRYEAGTSVNRLNAGGATFIPSANDPDNTQVQRFFSGAVSFAQRPTEGFGYAVHYQGLLTDRTLRNGPGGAGFQPAGNTRSDFEGRLQTLNARADLQPSRTNLITAGYEFEDENFINRSLPENPGEQSAVNVTQRSHAVFIQDQARLAGDRLQLSAAFRAQFFSLERPQLVPAAAAPYGLTSFNAPPHAYTGDGSVAYLFRASGTKVRAHAGNAYRAPSLYERFGTFFGSFGYSAYGDPRLRPERSVAFDAGLDQTLADNRLRLSATYFYTRLQEVIAFDFSGGIDPKTDPFGRFGGYLNTGGGLARGLELSVTAAPTRSLDLFASYTYTNSDQRVAAVAGILRTFVIPSHQFSVVATERLGRRLRLTFDLAAAGEYLAPVFDPGTFASRAYRFTGPVKADLGASYTIPVAESRSLRLFGKVDNLFDRENFESGFRTPGRVGLVGAAFSF